MFDPNEFSEVAMTKSSLNRKETTRPSLTYIDISVAGDFDALLFQNFYTSSISITQHGSTCSNTILENYKLMESAYCENGAQSWCQINVSSFNSLYLKGKPMRILLFQPATQWHKYEIRNIKALLKLKTTSNSLLVKETKFSITETLWNDFKILQDAVNNQRNMRAESFDYTTSDSKKEKKKKDKRKEGSKRPQNVTNTSSANIFNNTNGPPPVTTNTTSINSQLASGNGPNLTTTTSFLNTNATGTGISSSAAAATNAALYAELFGAK
jgi:hypothetical protein